MSEVFKRDAFADVVGTFFTLSTGEHTVDIELVEVGALKKRAFQESFSAVFLLPHPYKAEQGLYDLSHETLGTMQLLLVPIGMDKDRLKLEAVFNFVVEDDAGG